MSGFFGSEPIDQVATWVAALATLIVLGGLLGERRAFGWSQHLLAGLATGFLALIAMTEVIVPRLVDPIVADPSGRPELVVGLALVAVTAAAPWLPRHLRSRAAVGRDRGAGGVRARRRRDRHPPAAARRGDRRPGGLGRRDARRRPGRRRDRARPGRVPPRVPRGRILGAAASGALAADRGNRRLAGIS